MTRFLINSAGICDVSFCCEATRNKLMMITMIMTGIIDLIITTIKVIGNHNFQVSISQKQIRKL